VGRCRRDPRQSVRNGRPDALLAVVVAVMDARHAERPGPGSPRTTPTPIEPRAATGAQHRRCRTRRCRTPGAD
jgi:hypothetical protein